MKYGVIDIGSNSVRLLLWADGQTIYKKTNTTRLGAGVEQTRRLSPEAIARTAEAVRAFKAEAEEAGAVRVWAFATAAVRSAANGAGFTAAVKALVRAGRGRDRGRTRGAARACGRAGRQGRRHHRRRRGEHGGDRLARREDRLCGVGGRRRRAPARRLRRGQGKAGALYRRAYCRLRNDPFLRGVCRRRDGDVACRAGACARTV